jgi:hypothetical protein
LPLQNGGDGWGTCLKKQMCNGEDGFNDAQSACTLPMRYNSNSGLLG